ncbi:MAG TPA: DHH family phosphoesterase [Nitrososphaeraceae archaeon]|nr:DHH family phosphoesterase [Nitrososphaeraceae archaeon]
MKNVVIFSHDSDLDGIFSASIGLIRYPQARTYFIDYGAENFRKIGKFIDSDHEFSDDKGLIIISDLGFNENVTDTCKSIFNEAKAKDWKIIWVDHHPWSQHSVDSIKPFAEIVLDNSGRKCAAELMYETFLPGHRIAANLASIAHTMDFFTKDQYLTPISELIRYYHNFDDLSMRLSNLALKSSLGILWDIEMQGEYNNYVLLREKAKEQVLSTMRVLNVKDLKVAFIHSSPYLQTSLFSEEVFQRTQADLAMFYSQEGKVSIRRNTERISCKEIAEALPEGGGHKFAAGAIFHSNPTDDDAIITELKDAISKAIEKNTNTTQ